MSLRHTWYIFFLTRFAALVVGLIVLTFGLFIFVDIVSHIQAIVDKETSWKMWRNYYIGMFIYRLDIIAPFSIAIATSLFLPKRIRCNELIPLQTAGLSLHRIIQPCALIAIITSCLLWLNYQCIYPKVIRKYQQAVDSDFGKKTRPSAPTPLGVILFPEGGRLFFHTYNPKQHLLSDVFWIHSPDKIVHMETIQFFPKKPPIGTAVDLIQRDSHQRLSKTASHPIITLPELHISKEVLRAATAEPKSLSITQLITFAERCGSFRSERSTEILLALYKKLLFPLLAILGFLVSVPLSVRFEHRLSGPIIIFASLFILFSFILFVQASFILAKLPMIPMFLIIGGPWVAAFIIAIRRIYRLS